MAMDIFFKKYDNTIVANFEHTTKTLKIDKKKYVINADNDFIARCIKILNKIGIKWDTYTVK